MAPESLYATATNIWVYARDPTDARKHSVAREALTRLWESGTGRTSMQVLSEYYVNVTRRLSRPLSLEDAWEDVGTMLAWAPQPIDLLTEDLQDDMLMSGLRDP